MGWGWVEIGADKHYGWGQGWNWVKSSAGDGVGIWSGVGDGMRGIGDGELGLATIRV